MLNVSLRILAKAFGVDTQKSIFPYTFVNENNLNYIGNVPEFNLNILKIFLKKNIIIIVNNLIIIDP
jgi:hypothetical protein